MNALPSKRDVDNARKHEGPGLKVPKEDIYTSEFNVWLLIEEGWKFFIGDDGKVLGYLPPTLATRIGKDS